MWGRVGVVGEGKEVCRRGVEKMCGGGEGCGEGGGDHTSEM